MLGALEKARPEEGRAAGGHYKGVAWAKAEGKEKRCGRDRWADCAMAQIGNRAEDLPGGLKPGRVDGATERDREPQKKYRGLGSQRL